MATTTTSDTTTPDDNHNCTIITLNQARDLPRTPIDGKPTLVYWDIVGIAHPLRLALAAQADVEWVDVRLQCGGSRDMQANKRDWYQVKQELREEGVLEFPNLPYLLMRNDDSDTKEETVRLTQSGAILRFLSHKYHHPLSGNVDSNKIPFHVVDVMYEEARDLDGTLVRLSYEDGADAVRRWLSSDGLQTALQRWGEIMITTTTTTTTGGKKVGTDRFLRGSTTLTPVDLQLYTVLYKIRRALQEEQWQDDDDDESRVSLPGWTRHYMTCVETASTSLQAYIQALETRGVPVNNPHAKFGGSQKHE